MIGTRGCWIGLGTLIASITREYGPPAVACWCRSPASIALITARSSAEAGEPLLRLGKAVAVGQPLVVLPAGPDPQLHPARR